MNNTDRNEDLIWIKETLDNNPKSFANLVHKYNRYVYGLVLRMTQNRADSEDLTQEVFLRTYRCLDQYKVQYEFRDWLYRIAVNLTVDKLRKFKLWFVSLDQKKIVSEDDELGWELPDETANPEQIYLEKELRERIMQVVFTLPLKYRIVIILRYIEGLPYQKIAVIVNRPLGSVKTLLHRGQKILYLKMKHLHLF